MRKFFILFAFLPGIFIQAGPEDWSIANTGASTPAKAGQEPSTTDGTMKRTGKEAPVPPLSSEEQRLFEKGRLLYMMTCAPCHQPDGKGLEGFAPPLRDTHWVLGSVDRLLRIVLQGMRGPVTVHDVVYDMEMPGLEVLGDEDIASVLTYIRREWGHTAAPVTPATVARVRGDTADRIEAWTEEELLKIAK